MTIFTDEPRNMSFSDDLALALLVCVGGKVDLCILGAFRCLRKACAYVSTLAPFKQELALRPDCDYTGLLNLAGPEILNVCAQSRALWGHVC